MKVAIKIFDRMYFTMKYVLILQIKNRPKDTNNN